MDCNIKEISVRELHDEFHDRMKSVEEGNLRFLILWRRVSAGRRALLVPIQEWKLLCYFRGDAPEVSHASALSDATGVENANSFGGHRVWCERTSAYLVLDRIMSVDQFRQRMAEVLNDVQRNDAAYVLTRGEREVAAIIPPKCLSELRVYLQLQVRDMKDNFSEGRTLLGKHSSETAD